ncbi:MAG: hypothetical protein HC819_19320 [Cyclobacteriaceae bacterium]|nr:hypothetical protein [Cyclobacteriaceae bacterium]
MANQNPIYIDQRADNEEFVIPSEFKEVMIFLTIKVEILKGGWKYASGHNVYLNRKDIYMNRSPEPEDLKLNYAKNLDGLYLDLRSHISRFRDGSDDDIPAKVEYELIFEAGDTLIDSFSRISAENNPTDFNSYVLFKCQ